MALQTGPGGKVDRQTTTPFHLKLFYRTGSFHRLDEFPTSTTTTPLPPHLQIYTWPTCTLRELTHLLVSALPSLLPSPAIGTRLAFRLIFPDTRDVGRPGPGRYLNKELGSVVVGAGGPGVVPTAAATTTTTATKGEDEDEGANGVGVGVGVSAGSGAGVGVGSLAGELGGDADKTLQDARFVIGDYVSCAVFPPLGDGSVAPAPGGSGGSGRFGSLSGGAGGRGMNDFGGGRGGVLGGPRENGFGGFRVRGGARGVGPGGGFVGGGGGGSGGSGGRDGGGLPSGEWRRGERVPDGPGGGGGGGPRGFGRGRGRGF